MIARNKRNASHTWRAILYGREALELGLIKRIGDGANTRIWEDPWIPTNPGRKPLVRKTNSDVTVVQQLLDQQTGEWNEELLTTQFESVDAQAIMKIQTGRLEEDIWAWHLERHGNFTVRSAYKALLQANEVINSTMGSGGAEQVFWKRIIKGFIPCREVLKNRHIEKLGYCRECGEVESIHRALFECTWAKMFWQEIKAVTSVKLPVLHPSSWAMDLVDSTQVDPSAVVVILCGGWAVWSERNARDHGERSRSLSEAVKWTTDITIDLTAIAPTRCGSISQESLRWKPPVHDIVKFNVDAGFDAASGEGSSGLLIRDHAGSLLRAQAIWYGNVSNCLTMEALAVRDGVRLAADLGLSRVEVETDAKEVVSLWKDRSNGRSEVAAILHEIEELSSTMDFFKLDFIGRMANEGAHLCAKQASSSRRRCLWLNYIPTFLVQCLHNDCKPDD
jgi:ribonuclease HI